MARNRKPRDEGGGASWMDTYGDLVTLLLCFFVMLFASSTISEEKWQTIVEAFTGSPANAMMENIDISDPMAGGIMLTQGIDSNEEESEEEEPEEEMTPEEQALQEQIDQEINELYEQLNEYVQEQGMESSLILEREGMYINLTIAEGILFDSGRADIKDEAAEQMLIAIGEMLKQHIGSISVVTIEGHTDSDPIRNPVPGVLEDNIDLSNWRSSNVWRFIADTSGIDRSMFRGMGLAEYEPIASNDTEEGKQKNRRVRIVIMAKDARDVLAMAEEAGGEITVDEVIDVAPLEESTFSSIDE